MATTVLASTTAIAERLRLIAQGVVDPDRRKPERRILRRRAELTNDPTGVDGQQTARGLALPDFHPLEQNPVGVRLPVRDCREYARAKRESRLPGRISCGCRESAAAVRHPALYPPAESGDIDFQPEHVERRHVRLSWPSHLRFSGGGGPSRLHRNRLFLLTTALSPRQNPE